VGVENYFKPALTWPLRGITLSVQAVPRNCAFSVGGKVAIAHEGELMWMLALLNSSVADYMVRVFAGKVGGVQYESGLIERIPIPSIGVDCATELSRLGRRGWRLKRLLLGIAETSHAFLLPVGSRAEAAHVDVPVVERDLLETLRAIDEVAYGAYDVGPADRAAIEGSLRTIAATPIDEADAGVESADDEEPATEAGGTSTESWLVGISFGRFDPRLATGERAVPPEPEPFDPLPSRSPGMYPEGEDPTDRPDIAVDDEGHPNDLAAHVQRWAEHVSTDTRPDLRAWLAHEFFPLHIKMYSKSRRKAPIYWQLATPSASYSVWLYIHAFTPDTFFRVQNDHVAVKLALEERKLDSARREAGAKPSTADRRALAAQETFVDELRTFLDEVKRITPLWKPDLDDGVIINFAPLWRLVPQHKPWQKELKSSWDALCAGEYDWAHLAMHLWPERVVPKCAGDRSLAIAHGLEDNFWVEGTDGKWTARVTPLRTTEALVRARTSPAVAAALAGLFAAPTAAGAPARRGRGVRA
jgi:hypothetical protein